ncbi:MAG: hypothetical protein WDM81_02955 [Rhizomicrobium sp.]
MQRVLAALAFLAIIAVGSQARAACTVTPGFENGDVADATVLINDLNDLAACAAPLASPNFTGAVGIGTTTPGATLDVYASTGTGLNVEGGAGGVDIATFRRLAGAPVTIGLSGGAADAYMYLQDAAGVTWSTGVDDAASSSFKISNGDAPGTNDLSHHNHGRQRRHRHDIAGDRARCRRHDTTDKLHDGRDAFRQYRRRYHLHFGWTA